MKLSTSSTFAECSFNCFVSTFGPPTIYPTHANFLVLRERGSQFNKCPKKFDKSVVGTWNIGKATAKPFPPVNIDAMAGHQQLQTSKHSTTHSNSSVTQTHQQGC